MLPIIMQCFFGQYFLGVVREDLLGTGVILIIRHFLSESRSSKRLNLKDRLIFDIAFACCRNHLGWVVMVS